MTGRAAAGETLSAPVDERQLLDAIRAGNRGAAERIVERTYAGVFAALYRLSGNSDTAADLTQETYQKAWTALADFDGRSRLSTWLYRIAYTTSDVPPDDAAAGAPADDESGFRPPTDRTASPAHRHREPQRECCGEC